MNDDEPQRFIETNESGWRAFYEIIYALVYIAIIPIRLVIDIVRNRRG
jgi:hypothetical protein